MVEGRAPGVVGGVPSGGGAKKKKMTSDDIKLNKLERDIIMWSRTCHSTQSAANWELVTVAYDANGNKPSYVTEIYEIRTHTPLYTVWEGRALPLTFHLQY